MAAKSEKQPETNGTKPVGDVFDNLEGLRQSQSFNKVNTIKLFKTCPIRKPKKHEWFRVHPEYRLETSLFQLEEDDMQSDEFYLPVGAEVANMLPAGSLHEVIIFVWVNRKGNVFIWPIKQGDEKGQHHAHRGMQEVFTENAMQSWTRVEWTGSYYEAEIAESDLGEPKWPPYDFGQILRVAFKGRVIDNLGHPIFARLEGRE